MASDINLFVQLVDIHQTVGKVCTNHIVVALRVLLASLGYLVAVLTVLVVFAFPLPRLAFRFT